VLRQGACDALITAGNSCEYKALRQFVKKGEIIMAFSFEGIVADQVVGDGGFET
jgi:hypothetical protein